jgi:hypothetical protein
LGFPLPACAVFFICHRRLFLRLTGHCEKHPFGPMGLKRCSRPKMPLN